MKCSLDEKLCFNNKNEFDISTFDDSLPIAWFCCCCRLRGSFNLKKDPKDLQTMWFR